MSRTETPGVFDFSNIIVVDLAGVKLNYPF
jgi:hypothetical protein